VTFTRVNRQLISVTYSIRVGCWCDRCADDRH